MEDQIITLTGDNFVSYQAGVHYGSATALKDSAAHIRKLERHFGHQLQLMSAAMSKALPPDDPLQVTIRDLPNMSGALTFTADQMSGRAEQHTQTAQKIVHKLRKTMGTRQVVSKWGMWWFALVWVLALAGLLYALQPSR